MSEENSVTIITCGPGTPKCECQCPDGPCERVWDGSEIELISYDARHGRPYVSGSSATCSRCGMGAYDHDLWVSP
jgi:hypothetical protein